MSADGFDLTAATGYRTPGRRKNNLAGTDSPGVTDDETDDWEVMSIWVDATNQRAYICVDATTDNAVWLKMADIDAVGVRLVEESSTPASPDYLTTEDGTDFLYEDVA